MESDPAAPGRPLRGRAMEGRAGWPLLCPCWPAGYIPSAPAVTGTATAAPGAAGTGGSVLVSSLAQQHLWSAAGQAVVLSPPVPDGSMKEQSPCPEPWPGAEKASVAPGAI